MAIDTQGDVLVEHLRGRRVEDERLHQMFVTCFNGKVGRVTLFLASYLTVVAVLRPVRLCVGISVRIVMDDNVTEFTSWTIVSGAWVFRVPLPTLTLRPGDEVAHLFLRCLERLDVVVVVPAVDPIA